MFTEKYVKVLIVLSYYFLLVLGGYFAYNTWINTENKPRTEEKTLQGPTSSIDPKNSESYLSAQRVAKEALDNYQKIRTDIIITSNIDQENLKTRVVVIPNEAKTKEGMEKLAQQFKFETGSKLNAVVYVYSSQIWAERRLDYETMSASDKSEYNKNYIAIYKRDVAKKIDEITYNLQGNPTAKGSVTYSIYQEKK